MTPSERRLDRSLVHCHLDPLPRRWRRRCALPAEPAATAQDFVHYALRDYAQRRCQGGPSWRDLRPAYAFALATHAADWPRGAADTEGDLAQQWEQMRAESRLDWTRARAVVEDAWHALDHMPAAVVHGARH